MSECKHGHYSTDIGPGCMACELELATDMERERCLRIVKDALRFAQPNSWGWSALSTVVDLIQEAPKVGSTKEGS